MNARFWTFHNGSPVKLTVKEGRSLYHDDFEYTDEGWSRTSIRWMHEGDKIRREYISDGVDCDGRLTTGGEQIARLSELADLHYDGTDLPVWKKAVDYPVYDQYARAAGY